MPDWRRNWIPNPISVLSAYYSAPSTVASAPLRGDCVCSPYEDIRWEIAGRLMWLKMNCLTIARSTQAAKPEREAADTGKGVLQNGWRVVPPSGLNTSFRAGDGEKIDVASSRTDVFPVRGLVAVYVFITRLYGAVVMCGDEGEGLFLPFHTDTGYPAAWLPWRLLPSWSAYQGFWPCGRSGVMTSFPRERLRPWPVTLCCP